MKKLLLLIVLLPVMAFGQKLTKSNIGHLVTSSGDTIETWNGGTWKMHAKVNEPINLHVGGFIPKHQIIINGGNNKQLYLDLKGDSLKVSGDLKMDKAAINFIEFVKQQYTKEIFRLNHDSTEIIFNGAKYLKTKK